MTFNTAQVIIFEKKVVIFISYILEVVYFYLAVLTVRVADNHIYLLIVKLIFSIVFLFENVISVFFSFPRYSL